MSEDDDDGDRSIDAGELEATLNTIAENTPLASGSGNSRRRTGVIIP